MPQGDTAPSAPKGGGDGAYQPLAGPAAVVAVVGSAHVRGMAKAWRDSLAAPGQVQELLEV
jgi:pheromone shutdown protein TraB